MKYRVTSETDKTKRYVVEYFPKGNKWVCECPAYSFRKEGEDCKHIKRVRDYLKQKGRTQ